jgi:hypothetical protein
MKAIELNGKYMNETMQTGKPKKKEQDYCHYTKYHVKLKIYQASTIRIITAILSIVALLLVVGFVVLAVSVLLSKFLVNLIYEIT